jgi:hypothetical protein
VNIYRICKLTTLQYYSTVSLHRNLICEIWVEKNNSTKSEASFTLIWLLLTQCSQNPVALLKTHNVLRFPKLYVYTGLHVSNYSCQILTKFDFYRQIFGKYSNTKFHENPSSGSRVVPCGRTDMRKLFAILETRSPRWASNSTWDRKTTCRSTHNHTHAHTRARARTHTYTHTHTHMPRLEFNPGFHCSSGRRR